MLALDRSLSLLRVFSLPIALRVLGACLAYFVVILVVDFYGVERGGNYFSLMALWVLLCGVGKFGLDTLSLKYVAAEEETSKHSVARFFIGLSVRRLCCYMLFLIGLGLVLGATGYLASQSGLSDIWWYAVIACPFSVMVFVVSSCQQGEGYISLSVFANGVLISLFFIVLLALLSSYADYESLYVFATVAAAIVSIGIFLFSQRKKIALPVAIDMGVVNKASLFLTIGTLIALLNVWLGQIVVSAAFTDYDETIYGVGDRTSKLFMILLVAVNAVIAPRISRFWRTGDIDALRLMIKQSVAGLSLLGLLMFCIVVLLSDFIVSMFDLSGSLPVRVLLILCAGQLANMMTGPSVFLLTMTGHEKSLMLIQGAGLCFLLLLLSLMAVYGVVGVAIAQSLAVALFNIICLWYGFRMLRMRRKNV
jgi:O-antigen/teichoic acid export membrane protein